MTLVKDVMTENPVYVHASDLVTKVRSIMREGRYRALPVLEHEKLIGIISRGDVLKVTSSKTNLLVEGVMNRNIITTTPDEDLFTCAREMIKSSIRQLPVVENNKLVGIISYTDILSAFVENGYRPLKKGINEIMTSDVVYCEQEDELSGIWDKMYSSGFSGLPVLKRGKVIGMITRMDIMKEGSVRLSKESGKTKTVPVKKAMKTPAITITADYKIEDAAKTMTENRIVRLPVTDKQKKLIGIVDMEDIIKAYMG